MTIDLSRMVRVYDATLRGGWNNNWIDPDRQEPAMAKLARPIVGQLPHIAYTTDAAEKVVQARRHNTIVMVNTEMGGYPIRSGDAADEQYLRDIAARGLALRELDPRLMVGAYNIWDTSIRWPWWREASDGMDYYTYSLHLNGRVRDPQSGRYDAAGPLDVFNYWPIGRYCHELEIEKGSSTSVHPGYFEASAHAISLARAKGLELMAVVSQHARGETARVAMSDAQLADLIGWWADRGVHVQLWGQRQFDAEDPENPVVRTIKRINGDDVPEPAS